MVIIRILLLAFNVAVITFLIYRLLQIYKSSVARRGLILATGIILLLLPTAMLPGFIKPSPVYLFLYPVAISLYLYMIKNSEG